MPFTWGLLGLEAGRLNAEEWSNQHGFHYCDGSPTISSAWEAGTMRVLTAVMEGADAVVPELHLPS